MMRRNRKTVLIILLAVCILCTGIAVALSKAQPQESSEAVYRAWGELLNPKTNATEDETGLAMRANDFSISNQQFQQTVDGFVLAGYSQEEAVQRTKTLLSEKYAMYQEALQHGFEGRLDHVLEQMEQTKAGIESASNRGDYEGFLEGIGMTSDEYWESQIDNMMVYDAIHCYQESLKEAYEIPDVTPEEAQQQWEDYYQACVDQAVEKQEIEFLR